MRGTGAEAPSTGVVPGPKGSSALCPPSHPSETGGGEGGEETGQREKNWKVKEASGMLLEGKELSDFVVGLKHCVKH